MENPKVHLRDTRPNDTFQFDAIVAKPHSRFTARKLAFGSTAGLRRHLKQEDGIGMRWQHTLLRVSGVLFLKLEDLLVAFPQVKDSVGAFPRH